MADKASVQKTVCFRVDASAAMGIGHVMRCLTLANVLRAKGFYTRFICCLLLPHLVEKITQAGHDLVMIEPNTATNSDVLDQCVDAEKTLAAMADKSWDLSWDLMIVDHYCFDCEWEKRLRAASKKIMVIDDLMNRKHDCDILLDQNLERSANDYSTWVPEHCAVLVGPQYALLRPEFSHLRKEKVVKREIKNTLETLLISLGGSDQTDTLLRILQALKITELPLNCQLTLIAGASDMNKLQLEVKGYPWAVTILKDSDAMAQMTAASDVVIGAAGTSTWERCCLAVPSIIVVLAENQSANAQAMAAKKASLLINNMASLEEELMGLINGLVRFPEQRVSLGQAASAITDGLGVYKIIDRIQQALC
jgi:UDP-2,4-diacetamido-2,4,6-trideoxy-beta-L-altropyranose hydrolase